MDMKATAQRYLQLLNEYEAVRGAWADCKPVRLLTKSRSLKAR